MSEENIEVVENIPASISRETVDLFVQQKVRVTDVDPIAFMKNVESLIRQGCVLEENTYPSLRGPILEVKLVKPCNVNILEEDVIQNGFGYHAYAIEPSQFCYSEEFVKELPWATFKNLCKALGIGGRDRQKMTRQYLDATENYL